MGTFATFWEVDLHVHTPASKDVNDLVYGGTTPEDVVQAALKANLDAIAITDHNTTEWCDQVAAAAADSALIVLPGVEISTKEGHLLAIWEEGTPAKAINETLVRLNIRENDWGNLNTTTEVGFAAAAREVSQDGGIAIAAHIDANKGLLKLPVPATVRAILVEEALAAVEIVDLKTVETVEAKLKGARTLASVRGSDTTLPGKPTHNLQGIGHRRTWIKAARPDLAGIRHALADCQLRVLLQMPVRSDHPRIDSVELAGGFLSEQTIELSPDLNCLLGGTGAGKSLALEAIRYALDQQVNAPNFPAIWDEVHSRLTNAMGTSGVVRVIVRTGDGRYKLERAVTANLDGTITVYRDIGGDWVAVDAEPKDLLRLNAFSQGEALEYSRQAVGRMSLVDSGLDLETVHQEEEKTIAKLRKNATNLIAQRRLVSTLADEIHDLPETERRAAELSELFEGDKVRQQEDWKVESSRIDTIVSNLAKSGSPTTNLPVSPVNQEIHENTDIFEEISKVLVELNATVVGNLESIDEALDSASSSIRALQDGWQARFLLFKKQLEEELARHGDGANLVALRVQLEQLQSAVVAKRQTKERLDQIEEPRLASLEAEREALLDRLHDVRRERKDLRRARVAELNGKTGAIVKLEVSSSADTAPFRRALESLKVGSHVREAVLDAIATSVAPFHFGRAMLSGEISALAAKSDQIDETNLGRLLANIDDRDLWRELLDTQICDMPDRLNIKFRKPDDGQYAPIEHLAHGQRCTAILVIVIADGDAPVVVDQPEDALHAPWIEEYLVDRLRELRGTRQYIFATRSPGLVVSADAEQIVTMKATQGRGEVEAAGSLERHDLNRLALHHLEGGAEALIRRTSKLDASIRDR